MKNNFQTKLSDDYAMITKCIFKGLTNTEISKNINCSISCTAKKIRKLFNKYNVNSRIEFITNILVQVIETKKKTIQNQENIISKYENKIENSKEIIIGLIKNKNQKEHYQYWQKEAIDFIKKQ